MGALLQRERAVELAASSSAVVMAPAVVSNGASLTAVIEVEIAAVFSETAVALPLLVVSMLTRV